MPWIEEPDEDSCAGAIFVTHTDNSTKYILRTYDYNFLDKVIDHLNTNKIPHDMSDEYYEGLIKHLK